MNDITPLGPTTLAPRYVLHKDDTACTTATHSDGYIRIYNWYVGGFTPNGSPDGWTIDPESGVSLDVDEATRLLPVLLEFLASAGAMPPTDTALPPGLAAELAAAIAILRKDPAPK